MERDPMKSIKAFGVAVLWGIGLMMGWSCQSTPQPPLSFINSVSANPTLYATGIGLLQEKSPVARLQGIQAAKKDAARQLETQMLGLQIDTGTFLRTKAEKNPKFMEKIRAYAKNAEILETRMEKDRMTVKTRLVLGDDFKATMGLLPPKTQTPSSSQPASGGF